MRKSTVTRAALIKRMKRRIAKETEGMEAFHANSNPRWSFDLGEYYTTYTPVNGIQDVWHSDEHLEEHAREQGILKPSEEVDWER